MKLIATYAPRVTTLIEQLNALRVEAAALSVTAIEASRVARVALRTFDLAAASINLIDRDVLCDAVTAAGAARYTASTALSDIDKAVSNLKANNDPISFHLQETPE